MNRNLYLLNVLRNDGLERLWGRLNYEFDVILTVHHR